jgi:hypothetical protein
VKGSMARDYKKEYKYHGTPKQRKRRAARNRARYKMIKRRGKAALKGKDVHHKHGMSSASSNLAVISKHRNRGYRRSAKNKNLGLRKGRK